MKLLITTTKAEADAKQRGSKVETRSRDSRRPQMAAETSPHVLVFPYPAQGHVSPALKLAELLSLAGGLRVTFLNTEHFHRRLLRHSLLPARPNLRFGTIPDGLPPDHPRPLLHFVELEHSIRTRSAPHYRRLLLNSDDWPPVSCVVADVAMPLSILTAEELGIPVVTLRTSSASVCWAYNCVPRLFETGELPFATTDLDVPVKGVPGMEGFLRRRDLPSFCRRESAGVDGALQFVIDMAAYIKRGRGFVLNTFEAMEGDALSHVRSDICRDTFAVGPLHLLLRSRGGGEDNGVSTSFWEQDRGCIAWLDAQPGRSVVYVSFGSAAALEREQMLELWHGLVQSGHRFLWVVRPGEAAPPASERGMVVGWAPQEEVLSHPAVGCFVTHSGWNSTVEAVTAGVPMVCWPFFSDQQTNSRLVGEVWRVGKDMKDKNGRGDVERAVRAAMEGESAAEMRRAAAEMAEMARRSAVEGGSSYLALEKLVHHIRFLSAEVTDRTREPGPSQ